MEISYYIVRMPLKNPFTTSFGTDIYRESIIFRLSENGITAYSECVSDHDPFYSYEDNTTAMHIISEYLIKSVKNLPEPEEFLKSVSYIKGHNMAKAALEMLLYDYHARLNKKSLADYLGQNRGYAIPGISIGIDKIDKMLERIDEAVKMGYNRIKVKIKKGLENEILKSIRDVYPDISLSADANSDYTFNDIELLKSLDRYNLVYIEQPLCYDDLIYHSKLSREISTPICLDESITSSRRAEKAFEIGACSVINIKPGRVSGLTESIKIARIAMENNGHAWVGGMLETGIGRAYNMALAANNLIDYPGDTSPNARYYSEDLVKNPFTMDNGIISIDLKRPGTGIDVDSNALKKYTIDSGKFEI
ncbi:o-succinylbenzoate synthase [Picrophilus oshimae]|uniref:o-succinylbenzoate synthase n=1 Tax=Picrophilus torridus (strain ATCC 700027 / DSM 9790 / JCM 10055 / NBRC 100828 / KAW 2/3) TaxID=1122961 RepID=Q6L2V1_PICTO|nr:o-succinylbenzoate synthase [Picrophilus oshimae]AAT42701.1 O-succinylbenzoate-CoA synthase [Picrophilus oshimae DSM 9789]